MIGRGGSAARGKRELRAWLIPVVLRGAVFRRERGDPLGEPALSTWNLAQSAAERMQDANQIAPRLALWKYGWTMFKTHPLLGVGWGEFPRYQFEFVRELGGVEIANNSHDIFIDLLAKTGLLGLGDRAVRRGRAGSCACCARRIRRARIFGLALLGVLMMHALVEYPQQYMFFLMPAMLVFGLLETRPLRLVSRPVSFGLVCCARAGAWTGRAVSDLARLQPRGSAVLRLAAGRAISRGSVVSVPRLGRVRRRDACCR